MHWHELMIAMYPGQIHVGPQCFWKKEPQKKAELAQFPPVTTMPTVSRGHADVTAKARSRRADPRESKP